jgi:hypothetical protein
MDDCDRFSPIFFPFLFYFPPFAAESSGADIRSALFLTFWALCRPSHLFPTLFFLSLPSLLLVTYIHLALPYSVPILPGGKDDTVQIFVFYGYDYFPGCYV